MGRDIDDWAISRHVVGVFGLIKRNYDPFPGDLADVNENWLPGSTLLRLR